MIDLTGAATLATGADNSDGMIVTSLVETGVISPPSHQKSLRSFDGNDAKILGRVTDDARQ